MGIQQGQHAVLVDLAQLIAPQVAELFFIDHLEAAIDERLVRAVGLDGDFTVHQQAHLLHVLHEVVRARTGFLEGLVELQDVGGEFAGLAIVEQRLAFGKCADQIGGRIEAQRQFLRIGMQLGEHEGITADIGRNVSGIVGELAVLADEDVDAFVQAHQRDRHRIVADGEDDRHGPLHQREFVYGQRDGVVADDEGCLVGSPQLEAGMRLGRKRFERLVEKRKLGLLRRAGHRYSPLEI